MQTAVLGTSNSGGMSDVGGIVAWSMLLIILVVAAALVIVYARRRLLGDDDDGTEAFTLSDLVEMRRAGKLSEEEYRAARDLLLGPDASAKADAEPGRARGDTKHDSPNSEGESQQRGDGD